MVREREAFLPITMDFRNIRTHKGDQKHGFEELICQLARLQVPHKARRFIRKGPGGDGGIECYWILDDIAEVGWQAKFFLNPLEKKELDQISKSFKQALTKHPSLKTYYLAIPRDLSDSRAKRKGKTIVTERERWDTKKEQLEEFARLQGRTVQILEWFENDILTILSTDKPEYRGKQVYWFNQEVLSNEKFRNIFDRNKAALGERYTPIDHVEVDISRSLGAVFLDESFVTNLQDRMVTAIKGLEPPHDALEIETSTLKNFQDKLRVLLEESNFDVAQALQDIANLPTEKIERELRETLFGFGYAKETQDIRHRLQTKLSLIEDFFHLIQTLSFRVSCQGRLLVTGEAGTGKSHMLCDYSESRASSDAPTLFLLGQHYPGGPPLDFLKRECDVSSFTDIEFLGALSSIAEAMGSPFPIIIDALNEGERNDDWKNHLVSLDATLRRFPRLRLVVSCRSTYRRFIIPPEDLESLQWPSVDHPGFRGSEQEAVEQYFGSRSIIPPVLPFYPQQFSNPLLLKTFAELLQAEGHTKVPDGLIGLSKLFEALILRLEKRIAFLKNTFVEESVCELALSKFAEALFKKSFFGIPVPEARTLINENDPNPCNGGPLFDLLLEEGTLCRDYHPDGTLIVRFAYERLSEEFVARMILERARGKSQDGVSLSDALVEIILTTPIEPWQMIGTLTILSITLAETEKVELIDIFSAKSEFCSIFEEHVFSEDLLWRTPGSVTERTVEIFESQRKQDSFQSDFFDRLICLSTRPNHPLNANYLHGTLSQMKMPIRDEEWSIHVAVDGQNFESSEFETSNIWKLIRWARDLNIEECDEETAELAATTLSWILSTSNRRVRDHATKALARLFFAHPQIIVSVFQKFWGTDDLYILERIALAAYGAACRFINQTSLNQLANYLLSNCFSEKIPPANLILRDAAKGIILIAKDIGLVSIDDSKISPPFDTFTPLVIPTKEEMDSLEGDDFSSAVKSSLMGHPGDFGNYSMTAVTKWSTTEIEFGKPKSVREFQDMALLKLSVENRETYSAYLDAKFEEDKKRSSIKWLVQKSRLDSETNNTDAETKNQDADDRFDTDEIRQFLMDEAPEEYKALGHYALSAPSDRSKPEFSKRDAQRWVCKRVHELGWSSAQFGAFEENYVGYSDRNQPTIERIGKKYQWIAYYEFLAHLSDQFCFINPGYSDVVWDRYFGPWQVYERNLDPTNFEGLREMPPGSPCPPFLSSSIKTNTVSSLEEWFSGSRIFDKLREWIVCSFEGSEWICLGGFQKSYGKLNPASPDEVRLDEWFRITSCLVLNSDCKKMVKCCEGEWLGDPHVFEPPSNSHDGFLYEFPWHPFYQERPHEKWFSTSNSRWSEKEMPDGYLPLFEYNWEFGASDQSSQHGVRYFHPSPKLIKGMELIHSREFPNVWTDKNGSAKFITASNEEADTSLAWIERATLIEWLRETEMTLFLTVGGEKNIYEGDRRGGYKRKNLNALCLQTADDLTIKGWEETEGDLDL